MRFIVVLAIFLGTAEAVYAQAAATPPVKLGDVVVAGSLRTRAEAWNWFKGAANEDYVYSGNLARLGLTQTKPRYDWQVEFAVPFLLGLPDDAVASAPQGQFGLGASYFAANNKPFADKGRNTAEPFVKQATFRVKGLGGIAGQSLRAGRIEFIDGTEVVPPNATLAAVKRDRIAHRLLGNFAFSHVGRSFDGVQYVLSNQKLNFTFLGARPTRGVFQVNGWGELDINVFYGALTGQAGTGGNASEWRVFGIAYDDRRDGVLKTDNRSAAARTADKESITMGTFGGHYLRTAQTPQGAVDVLLWGALQTGSWGTLDHRAGAFAAEAGWQPKKLTKVAPWFRGGYNYGSGDADPNDTRHGTFFQLLPTPRVYARLPFFNMMNNGDGFGEVILRPSGKLNIRTDVHVLRVARNDDLWYVGGGAFQPSTFGFAGRPSNGHSGLATLYDASGDYRVNGYASVTVYYGWAAGRPVTEAIYPNGENASLGYAELTLRF